MDATSGRCLFRRRLLFTLVASLLSTDDAAFAQGSLTPPGGPAPMMKSLDQIEARTPISSAPFTISAPGSYYLTGNLTVSSGNAITIATDGVTLDLNGFTIRSTAATATGTAILLSGGPRNITIANGFIQGGVTNNGSGVYSGSGFIDGIDHSNPAPGNVLVSRVSVSGCLNFGIRLSIGEPTVVESCTVRTVGSLGIVATTVKTSSASDCGGHAIAGYVVSDSRGESAGNGGGVQAFTAQNCYGSGSGTGTGVYATTAQDCYGLSSSSRGVSATTAVNCFGFSNSGDGVNAISAQNCYGASGGNGAGVYAETAQNCYGSSNSGHGVHARTIATSCYGETGGAAAVGLFSEAAAVFCSGSNVSGGGNAIAADNAIGCTTFDRPIAADQKFLGTP